MKEYIIPIEDIIVKPELFYAHCDRGNGKNPEILKEHVDRCYHYFEELWEHKNFKAVFENFQKELAPELSDEGIKLFYSLIVNVIIFHDCGKINPRFQSIKMKNTLKKWTAIDCLDGTKHSILSAAIEPVSSFFETSRFNPDDASADVSPIVSVADTRKITSTEIIAPILNVGLIGSICGSDTICAVLNPEKSTIPIHTATI